jgi:4-hydroxy-tetrahydrodipicolinate reductase
MGRCLATAIAASDGDAVLAAAIELPGSPFLGQDPAVLCGLPAGTVRITDDPAAAAQAVDVLVDFTVPASFPGNLAVARAAGKALVAGTTGLSPADHEAAAAAGREIPLIVAANFSLGIALLARLVKEAADRLGDRFDIEIVETHHSRKKDAPSGTALRLAQAAAEGAGIDLAAHACYGRSGLPGERPAREIGIHAVRGGDVVGEHTVGFYADGERIELTHKASSRMTFAHGAIRAAIWLAGKSPGLYPVEEALGLHA